MSIEKLHALEEHSSICSALAFFEQRLGDGFAPISDSSAAIDSPFGPALIYRSWTIASLWSSLHMAKIATARSHPSMPAAPPAAIASAAPHTRTSANAIGRICAALTSGPPTQHLSPAATAVLLDTGVPVFFAAVQYTDSAQRHATVTRINAIAQRTGWKTPAIIANGCEEAWVRAAQAGRGPAWTRMARQHGHADYRLSGRDTASPSSSPSSLSSSARSPKDHPLPPARSPVAEPTINPKDRGGKTPLAEADEIDQLTAAVGVLGV